MEKIWYLLEKYGMKKIVGLTESDLMKIVKRIIKENDEEEYFDKFKIADEYAGELYIQMLDEIDNQFYEIIDGIDFSNIVEKYQNKFKQRYSEFANISDEIYNNDISDLMSFRTTPITYENYSDYMSEAVFETIKLN